IAVPLTGYLNRSGCYHGFDIVPDGIAWCRKQISPRFPHFHFQLADVHNPLYHPAGRCPAEEFSFPYDNGTFDVVLLASVFTHMRPAAVERYLAEVARVLKPAGRCLSTFFLLNPIAQELLAHGAGHLCFPHRADGARTRNAACPEE